MLEDYEIFVRTVEEGGMSAAGRLMDLAPAAISKRIARLEDRLDVRLLERTTRRLTPTDAGRLFYDHASAILDAAAEAEALVSRRASVARGLLRVSAPTSFGRRHLAPHLKAFLNEHTGLTLELNLTDTFVDLMAEGVDLALRISTFEADNPAHHWLAANRRLICATPAYLDAHGVPADLQALRTHRLLAASNQTLWRLDGPEGRVNFRARSAIRTNSSEVARETLLADMGIALRSLWDVGEELRRGDLRVVLPDYVGASDVAIFAVASERARNASRTAAFLDFLKSIYARPAWEPDTV